jgi:hypothetical protein
MSEPSFASRYYSSIKCEPFYTGRGVSFLSLTSWYSRNGGFYDELYDEQCYTPVACKIVGTVSSNGLYIEPHGDFNPPGELKDALLRFTLEKPHVEYAQYREDFDIGVDTLKTLINSLCDNPKTSNLIEESDGRRALTFSHPVFSKKVGFPFCFLSS